MSAGLGFAALIVAAWLAGHVYGVFFHRWTLVGFLIAPLLAALQCWLSVGLFIVAHDCMHGSLAPFRPALNRWIGRFCLALYAGFSYDRLITKHFDHHRFSGTERDPDFLDADPTHFWRWYTAFFLRYFGWRPLAFVTVLATIEGVLLHAGLANLLVFWAAPAILSSVQLFFFGTYLPHRHEEAEFEDAHNARSNDFSWLLSFATCFHFGYHHEHHTAPHVPWWKLPHVRSGTSPSPVARA
jgi:beta-carotene/zeaxanthin 4-ketolase